MYKSPWYLYQIMSTADSNFRKCWKLDWHKNMLCLILMFCWPCVSVYLS